MRIFRHYLPMPLVGLALLEALIFFGVPYLAIWLGFGDGPQSIGGQPASFRAGAAVFAAVLMICMVAVGLYSSRLRASTSAVLVRVSTSVLATVVILAVLYFFLPRFSLGRGLLGLSALLAFAGAVLTRLVFSRLVDEDIFKRRVLVFGCGRQAVSISRLRRRSDQRGFLIVGYVQPQGDEPAVPIEKVLAPRSTLLDLAREHEVEEIVVAMDDRRRAFPVQELLECRLSGVEVTDVVTFLERETGRVRLDVLNPSWMIFSEGFRRDPLRMFSERAFDLAASVLLLAITWPVMLLTVLAIKLEDGWSAPVLFRQIRVGLDSKLFSVLKFRSMGIDAERDGQARWAQENDSRVTRVGALIRKIRVDELPQIFNVFKGDMSFVGPRPERPEFVAALNERIPYYRERHCVKPGITGWAQLCYPYGSSEHDAAEKLQYDLYYVKNHSLLFDLMILLQTAEVILWRKGGR